MQRGGGLALLLALLATLAWLWAGCTSFPAVIEAAGKDQANLCATYVGLYGRVTLSRSNLGAGTLTCNADGHRIAPE